MSEDFIPSIGSVPGKYFYHDSLKYSTKHYNIEPKSLFSAFELKSFAIVILKSFLCSIFLLWSLMQRWNTSMMNFYKKNRTVFLAIWVFPPKSRYIKSSVRWDLFYASNCWFNYNVQLPLICDLVLET